MLRKKNRKDRSGVTLVELLVATLIGIIIFTSWLEICNPKPVRKESYRRLAVEQAAGYLDLMPGKSPSSLPTTKKYYQISVSGDSFSPCSSETLPVFPDNADAVVGYTSSIENSAITGGWPDGYCAVVRLYDRQEVADSEAGTPFFTLSAYIGGGN